MNIYQYMIRKGNYESTNKKWVDDTFEENLRLFNNILLFKKTAWCFSLQFSCEMDRVGNVDLICFVKTWSYQRCTQGSALTWRWTLGRTERFTVSLSPNIEMRIIVTTWSVSLVISSLNTAVFFFSFLVIHRNFSYKYQIGKTLRLH